MDTIVIRTLLTLISLTALATVQADPVDYLKNMQKAAADLNYEGTFVYMRDGRMDSLKIYHKADARGEFERVIHLNGSPREVLRENDKVTCILPDKKSIIISSRGGGNHLFTLLPEDLRKVVSLYRIEVHGLSRVAGRDARLVSVRPRDRLRYGYNLWLDDRNHLLLKSELINENGDILEQVMFTELKIVADIPQASLVPGMAVGEYARLADALERDNNGEFLNLWKLRKLPAGFRFSHHKKQSSDDDSVPLHQLIISDGLASVSVYIEKLPGDGRKFVGASYMGAMNIFGLVINEHQITVVGDVPGETVRMVANSVHYEK